MRSLFAALVLFLLAAPASAQSSGGSAGSSDFGGGGGGGGGGSSSGGYSSSSGSSGSSGGSSSAPPSAATFAAPEPSLGSHWHVPASSVPQAERAARQAGREVLAQSCCVVLPFALFGFLGLSWYYGSTPEQRNRKHRPCEVRRISVAFDWTVRKTLQEQLASMTSALSAGGSENRRSVARSVASQLRASLDGARFATFQSFHVNKQECQQRFEQMRIELRSRFKYETAGERAAGVVVPEMRALEHEGGGLVVVSVVLATDGWLNPLPTALDRASLAQALTTFTSIAAPTVFGIEVAWSPSKEEDRMSSLELGKIYPELQPLEDVPRLGGVACTYCRAPFPSELGSCPGCGAPYVATY